MKHGKIKCKHSFNYKYLFNELKHQKMYNGLEITHLSKRQIKCPYCRTIQNGLIPWKEGFAKVKGVNDPPSLYYKGNKCSYCLKSGKRKGATSNSLLVNIVKDMKIQLRRRK